MADAIPSVQKQQRISRGSQVYQNVKSDVAANVNTSTVDAICIEGFAAGGFYSTTIGANAVTFYACETPGGTFRQVYDSTGSAVSLTAASSVAFDIPSACFSWPFLKICNAGGAITNVVVSLKG